MSDISQDEKITDEIWMIAYPKNADAPIFAKIDSDTGEYVRTPVINHAGSAIKPKNHNGLLPRDA